LFSDSFGQEFDVHSRDELTDEWLQQKLAFFK
jgi:hypothetical protein